MNPVYRAKPAVWTKPIPFFGGRLQTVNLDGNVYEVKKHKMNGLHLQQFHYPLLDMQVKELKVPQEVHESEASEAHTRGPVKSLQGRGPKSGVMRTKKNISSILRGGALAPL